VTRFRWTASTHNRKLGNNGCTSRTPDMSQVFKTYRPHGLPWEKTAQALETESILGTRACAHCDAQPAACGHPLAVACRLQLEHTSVSSTACDQFVMSSFFVNLAVF